MLINITDFNCKNHINSFLFLFLAVEWVPELVDEFLIQVIRWVWKHDNGLLGCIGFSKKTTI